MSKLNIRKIEEGISTHYKIDYFSNHEVNSFNMVDGNLKKLVNFSIDKLCEDNQPKSKIILAIEGKLDSKQHEIIRTEFDNYAKKENVNLVYVIRC